MSATRTASRPVGARSGSRRRAWARKASTAGHAVTAGGALLGDGERADPHEVLGGQAEGPARGRHQGEIAARLDQVAGERAGRPQHVLAVVEHEDRLAARQGVAHGGRDLVVADRSQPERGSDDRRDAALVGDGGQLDHDDVTPGVGGVGRGLERQPGLADAARADDRDQALGRHPAP